MEDPLKDVDRVKRIKDPAERAREIGRILNAIPAITAELRALRQAAAVEMREGGMSLAQIGEALGVHRNRAQQIVLGKPGGGKGGGRQSTEE